MTRTTHTCGGTILSGGSGDQAHIYCDRCSAYTYETDGEMPCGTDPEANRAAFDGGDESSPDDDGCDALTHPAIR